MCCFSKPVQDVSNTKIFARIAGAYQIIAYQMEYDASEDLAMILPIPIVPNSPEDAVKFINLEKYPDFFFKIENCFPAAYAALSRGMDFSLKGSFKSAPLEVKTVGNFEASFVPTIDDFDRIDERFKLPKEIWRGIPEYADYGFVVFKLKKGKKEVHPMCFKFPTRDVGQLFYPTMHVHDGESHSTEKFNHTLYYQTDSVFRLHGGAWTPSAKGLEENIEGVVLKNALFHKKKVNGNLANKDLIYRFTIQS